MNESFLNLLLDIRSKTAGDLSASNEAINKALEYYRQIEKERDEIAAKLSQVTARAEKAEAELAKLREQKPVVMPRFCDDAISGLETMVLWLEMLSRGECFARSTNLADDPGMRKATIRDAMKYADMCLDRIRPALAELDRFAIEYCGTAANHGLMNADLYAAPVPAVAAPAVPDGWNGWRDVAVHGYPEKPMECMFVLDGRTVHGAYLGGAFWFSNERVAIALWMPMPKPLSPDSHRALLQSATSAPASAAAPAVPEEWCDKLLAEFPLLDDKGLCQEKHHCEWALQQDRKRLHALLQSAPELPHENK